MKDVAPMVFAAKSNPLNAGGMADNSDHMNLDDRELEHIKHQSLAFE